MRLPKIVVLLCAIGLLNSPPLSAAAQQNPQTPERVLWDKKPIAVLLAVGQERLIHFPSDIRYWLPDSVKTKVNALSANGVLYLEALKPMEKVRVRVQAIDSPQLYLLDITATQNGDYPTELIVLQEANVVNRAKQVDALSRPIDWRIRLTRFAAQSLYAPERLIPADAAIRRVSVDTTTAIPLVRGGDIEAIPVASWRGGGLTVTAIRLRNLSQQTLVVGSRQPLEQTTRLLDLTQDIRGEWLTASVQHSLLKATGNHEDRTCLYLVSKQPFEAAL